MAGTPPPKRRRRKSKKAGSRPGSRPAAARQSGRKTTQKHGLRISGLLVLMMITGIFVSAFMYAWAAGRVQDFLAARRSGQDAVLSATSTIYSSGLPTSTSEEAAPGGAAAIAGNHAPLSIATWRRLLTSHGYTESAASAPRTFAIDSRDGSIVITQGNGARSTVSRTGTVEVKDSEPAARIQNAVTLEAVPLGDFQSSDERVGFAVPLQAFSPAIRDAVVAVEDERFYHHFGIDVIGVARAFLVNLAAGTWVQGGSTLTQQLAKNIFLTAERSLTRKFKEVFLSLALERALTKDQLLELYLNEVYLGSQAGNPIRGIPVAARWLFNKSPGALTVSESALLAGMIHAPAFNNPRTRPENAEARRRVALQRLFSNDRISNAQWKAALADRPRIFTAPQNVPALIPSSGMAPFVAVAARSASAHSTDAATIKGIQTTISPPLQRCAESAVSAGAQQVVRRIKRREPGQLPQVGFVALDVERNAIVALVGGTNFAINKRNHVTDIRRQFGSTVKPFVYLRAFERGTTLSSPLLDEPLADGKWNPENYDRQFRGMVTASYALENSLNLPTIRLAQRIGLPVVARAFYDFALVPSTIDPYPALAVGALEGTLFDLTNAYAALARGGRYARANELFSDAPPQFRRIADERAVFLVTNALQGVIQRGTARGLNAGDFPSIAGKTGTSDSTRDAWFVGYTPTHAVGVWVGFDNNRPLGLTGGAAAAPIAGDFLRCASELIPRRKFVIPHGVSLRESGENDAGDTVQEFYIDDDSNPSTALPANSQDSSSSAHPRRSWFDSFGW